MQINHAKIPLADRPFFTIPDLVSFGYSRNSWYKLAREGKIKLRKIGGITVVLRSDFEDFLNTLPDAGSKSS